MFGKAVRRVAGIMVFGAVARFFRKLRGLPEEHPKNPRERKAFRKRLIESLTTKRK